MTEAKIPAGPVLANDRASSDPLLGLAPLSPPEGSGDTWITIGDPLDTEHTEERTVTVVFRPDPLDDFDTGEYLLRPLDPLFPGRG